MDKFKLQRHFKTHEPEHLSSDRSSHVFKQWWSSEICHKSTQRGLQFTIQNSASLVFQLKFKGELNPKIDFSSFEHLGIVEQLYEVFLSC